MSELNKNNTYHLSLTFLKWFKIYPDKTKRNSKQFYAKKALLPLATLVLTLLNAVHLIVVLQGNTDADFSEDLTFLSSGSGLLITCVIFAYNHKKWSKLFYKITNFREYGTPRQLQKSLNHNRFFSRIYVFYCFTGYALYSLISLYKSKCQVIENRFTFYSAIVPIALPTVFTSQSVILINFLYQFVTIGATELSGAMISLIIWETSQLIALHINHFKDMLHSNITVRNISKHKQMLKVCAAYHLQIMRFSNDLNYLTMICFGHISLLAPINLAAIANQILKSNPIGAIINLTAWMVGVFLLCDAGQRITDENESVGNMIFYNLRWYEMEGDLQKKFLFMIMRTQKPIYLDALPLGSLNYSLFHKILKTSYSFFTLLLQAT